MSSQLIVIALVITLACLFLKVPVFISIIAGAGVYFLRNRQYPLI